MNKVIIFTSALLVAATLFVSCKKYEDPALYFEEYGKDTALQAKRKVLLIVIDGVSGTIMKEAVPANIDTMLLPHSKYSWGGRSDGNSSNAATWASMVLGVGSGSHGMVDSTFQPFPKPIGGGYDENSVGTYYPTLFARLIEAKPLINMVAITPWKGMGDNLMQHIEHKMIAHSDKEVNDSAVSVMSKGNPDMMIVNFNEVEKAGQAGGYSRSNTAYATALTTTDEYVGNIVKAMKARPTYDQEKWLVIVTSNHGNNKSSVLTEQRNIFAIYYNKDIVKQQFGISEGLTRIYGTLKEGQPYEVAQCTDDKNIPSSKYTIPLNGELTVEFMFQYMKLGVDTHPYVLGKAKNRGGCAGWNFFVRYDRELCFYASSVAAGTTKIEHVVGNINDGKWHKVAAVIKNSAANCILECYLDGIKTTTTAAIGGGNIYPSPYVPLTIGQTSTWYSGPESYPGFYISDIRIWNKALDATTISGNSCLRDFSTHPNKSNLVGYWPCNDGGGTQLSNGIEGGYAFDLTGTLDWKNSFNDLLCDRVITAPATVLEPIVPQNVDIYPNVMYWLKAPIKTQWGLAEAWLDKYKIEFLK